MNGQDEEQARRGFWAGVACLLTVPLFMGAAAENWHVVLGAYAFAFGVVGLSLVLAAGITE